MKKTREKGIMTLEASVALVLFIFMMLFLYSLFIVFETRNELAHVVLATANSLALDTYETDKLQNSGTLADIFGDIYNSAFREDSGFTSGEVWNKIAKGSEDANTTAGPAPEEGEPTYVGWDKTIYVPGSTIGTNQGKTSSVLESVIKERFVAYLADGDEAKADEILKNRYHVHDGMNGISFAESHIKSSNIYIVIHYKLDLEYSGLMIGKESENFIEFEQSACSKLWN